MDKFNTYLFTPIPTFPLEGEGAVVKRFKQAIRMADARKGKKP